MGLVSYTSVNPPAMGWLYADRGTLEIKYGNRSSSCAHIVGPWDWTPEDKTGLLLETKESFVAVEESKGVWGVYFDRMGDGTALPRGKTVLPISIDRVKTGKQGYQDRQ